MLPTTHLTELLVGEDCMAAKAKLVTGLFKSKIAAESAVDALLKRGFSRDDISVLMSDATRTKEFALQTRTHAADGLGIGSAVGGAVGAVLAAIAAVGTTLFLPGINLVIARPHRSRARGRRRRWSNRWIDRSLDWCRHSGISRESLRSWTEGRWHLDRRGSTNR